MLFSVGIIMSIKRENRKKLTNIEIDNKKTEKRKSIRYEKKQSIKNIANTNYLDISN